MRIIDLRSDTVTKPTEAMRLAMTSAEVGDDVYGEDPSVNKLQELAAEMSGKEAALLLPSGTMSNLVALLSHCQRGEEYIVGQQAHTYKYEGGGAAVLGSIQPQPLDLEPDGSLDLGRIRGAIKPRDAHFAITRLVCLENTQGGKVLPLEYQAAAARLCRDNSLALHLDGARICNAAVAQRVPIETICRHYDSVSICLSKGLGAPIGSVLVGTQEFIQQAHRWRKMCGGGMRQAGIIAEAGFYALKHQVARLEHDHALAHELAEGLSGIEGLRIDLPSIQTNMVFVDCAPELQAPLKDYLHERGILVGGYGNLRLVTHLDIHPDDVPVVVESFKAFFSAR